MNRRHSLLAAFAGLAALGSQQARAQASVVPPSPAPQSATVPRLGELKSLGQDRYQVGRIVVDKRARSFAVPGRIHLLDRPLEYLATSPGGVKEYEALLELDATGSEFNLACILVGLERDPRHAAARQVGPAPLPGPRVAISIAWSEAGKRRQLSAAQALLNPEAGIKPETVAWVYTGSPASDGQDRFAADATGTLIGFKPDDNAIVESALGIGIGAYGSVRGHAMLPPVGSVIELIVDAASAAR